MFQEIKEAPMAEVSKGGVGDNVREIGVWEEKIQIPEGLVSLCKDFAFLSEFEQRGDMIRFTI